MMSGSVTYCIDEIVMVHDRVTAGQTMERGLDVGLLVRVWVLRGFHHVTRVVTN